MPGTEYQGSSVPFASIGRSILSIRRDQVHSMDGQDQELDSFQKHVADLFLDLSAAAACGGGGGVGDEILSLSWIRKLLDAFLICQEEFRVVLFNNKTLISRPPLDRLISEFFDRGVKALDVCNAVRDGIDQVRQWQKHLEIVIVSLLDPKLKSIGCGQLRRAKKALTDLTLLMLNEKDTASYVVNHHNRSFCRRDHHSHPHHRPGHFRSVSWTVSRYWSAALQLQAIGNNLNPPRVNEMAATNALAIPVFAMNSVLLFVMWALVAAIPCQDRGLQTHFSIPRSFPWAASVMSLHERILEESKKRDRKNSNGLLKEIHQIEKCTRHLNELMDSVQVPLAEEREVEVRHGVQELVRVCDALKDGLDPLEIQVREVFHGIVRSRTEGLDCLRKLNNAE